MPDEDVIWFAVSECAFLSREQLICVVCFAEAPGIRPSVNAV